MFLLIYESLQYIFIYTSLLETTSTLLRNEMETQKLIVNIEEGSQMLCICFRLRRNFRRDVEQELLSKQLSLFQDPKEVYMFSFEILVGK